MRRCALSLASINEFIIRYGSLCLLTSAYDEPWVDSSSGLIACHSDMKIFAMMAVGDFCVASFQAVPLLQSICSSVLADLSNRSALKTELLATSPGLHL